ncbi:MAG TPA: substrate-binding domain-containing protein, partial [Anaerolineaceae bacterium]|nr:substrate-binding domain-containing protein [Anaerolineaceae bacterium]
PEEVSVVGFDDQRLAPYLSPALTTVRAPTEEVGRVAVRQLLKVMQKQAVEATVLLQTEIIYRNSCGCK